MNSRRLLIALLFVACSKPAVVEKPVEKAALPPPTLAEAKQIIEPSSDFSEFEFTNSAFTLPMKRSMMLNDPTRNAARDLQKAGWIDFSGDDVLLRKGATDKRFITRPNGYIDIVPLARKEMGEVTAVRPTSEGLDADFNWKWVTNDVGSSFKAGPLYDRYATPKQGTATLYQDGGKWVILRIRPRP